MKQNIQRFEHVLCHSWDGRARNVTRDPISAVLHSGDVGVMALQAEGWELVSVTTTARNNPTYYLKRPVDTSPCISCGGDGEDSSDKVNASCTKCGGSGLAKDREDYGR